MKNQVMNSFIYILKNKRYMNMQLNKELIYMLEQKLQAITKENRYSFIFFGREGTDSAIRHYGQLEYLLQFLNHSKYK
jgi:hypothetical protein